MNQERRGVLLARVEDSNLRAVAEEHPECVHPCVWLVKDEEGPFTAGGKPRLPVGREWPREGGKLLAYLLSIDTSRLPEWSPLPRDCGELLVFVGGNTCQIVAVGRGVETREVEPPVEEYMGGEPTAGDVLEVTRFRLEEGLHAGVPETWSVSDDDPQGEYDDVMDELYDLNGALRPAENIGRLFGHHDWWVGVDAASITRYSYLDVNGYRGGWYANLDGSLGELRRKLESARVQAPLAEERLPMMAESVVRASEEWVERIEEKVAARREVADADAREKVESVQRTLARRRKRWQAVKAGDAVAANQALEELVQSAGEIDREMERIPVTRDREEFEARRKAVEDDEAERLLQWSQRAQANLKEEARIRREYGHDPKALDAAMQAFRESKRVEKSAYSELVKLLTPMQYACRTNDCDVIRRTWREFEDKLNECASQLKASEIATALHWRLHGYQSLAGWLRRGWVDPEEVAGKIAAVEWWQGDVARHEGELAHWRPLLVLDSDGGPYFWGDAGWAIILADMRAVAKGELGRLAIAVDVS